MCFVTGTPPECPAFVSYTGILAVSGGEWRRGACTGSDAQDGESRRGSEEPSREMLRPHGFILLHGLFRENYLLALNLRDL
jgi:hypothetical protein